MPRRIGERQFVPNVPSRLSVVSRPVPSVEFSPEEIASDWEGIEISISKPIMPPMIVLPLCGGRPKPVFTKQSKKH